MVIFVTLHNGTRYAFVGDLVWQLEGITLREERPWFSRKLVDLDAEGTRENLLRMIAIKERLPEMIIVPAHDMRAFADMPKLSQASSETVVTDSDVTKDRETPKHAQKKDNGS